jgi:hypothetical protein
MGIVIVVMYAADHPAVFGDYRVQIVNLDRAFTDEADLERHLTRILNAKIHRVTVRKIDLVNDTTSVEVRCQQTAPRSVRGSSDITVKPLP